MWGRRHHNHNTTCLLSRWLRRIGLMRDASPSYAKLAATWCVPLLQVNPRKKKQQPLLQQRVCSSHLSTKLFLYFKNIFLNSDTILIYVNQKVVCFDCCGGIHLDLCSNTASLGSILYSLGLKDYSLTEQSGKHVNNLVGLHSACTLWQTQTNTIRHTVLHMNQNHRRACASKSHALSQTHTHTHKAQIQKHT